MLNARQPGAAKMLGGYVVGGILQLTARTRRAGKGWQVFARTATTGRLAKVALYEHFLIV